MRAATLQLLLRREEEAIGKTTRSKRVQQLPTLQQLPSV